MNRHRSLLHYSCFAVIINSFKYHLSNGEFISTEHSVLPGPKLSSNRQHFPFCQVQDRAQIDSAFCLPGPVSNSYQQRTAFYQVKCRAPIDSALFFTRSNVLKSVVFCFYHVQCRAKTDKLFAMFCDVLCDLFRRLLPSEGCL